MGNSDWDSWYTEFEKWPPEMLSFVDKQPGLKLGEHVWVHCHLFTDVSARAVERFVRPDANDVLWLIAALQHERQRYFVARLARTAGSFSEVLLTPLLRAAVEVNYDYWRVFIEPCVQSFGARRVKQHLVSLTASTDQRRAAGAIGALGWVGRSYGRNRSGARKTR